MNLASRAVVFAAALAVLAVAGCASRPSAPVIERSPGAPAAAPAVPVAPAADAGPETYTVRRGDTLYGIALDHGLDYRELADWNGISNPNLVRTGEVLRLRAPSPAAVPERAAQVRPIAGTGAVESRPLGPATQPAIPAKKPDEATLARIDPRRQEAKPSVPSPVASVPSPVASVPSPGAKPEPQAMDDEKLDWAWPASGKLIAKFSDPSSKGVDIAAKQGDPVLASAAGRVVYSGSGLRGYGRLVIIKHSPTYLSAYAHNSQLLVKEGQNVTRGQKIAEVGATDTDSPKLHFEIRRMGKPVDPLRYLPDRPS